MSYIVMLASNSHHLMSESDYYRKIFIVSAANQNDLNNQIDYLQRKFSLSFRVPLSEVYCIWSFKIKDNI